MQEVGAMHVELPVSALGQWSCFPGITSYKGVGLGAVIGNVSGRRIPLYAWSFNLLGVSTAFRPQGRAIAAITPENGLAALVYVSREVYRRAMAMQVRTCRPVCTVAHDCCTEGRMNLRGCNARSVFKMSIARSMRMRAPMVLRKTLLQSEISVRRAVDSCCRLPFLRHTPLKELYRLSRHMHEATFKPGDMVLQQVGVWKPWR